MTETPRSQTPFRHRTFSISAGEMHIVEAGPETGPAVVFLHGWPQDWHAFASIMALAAPDVHAIAIDLPGIGKSRVANAPGDKRGIAPIIRTVMTELGLTDVSLVGHDVGGQIVFAFLTSFPDDLQRAVIMDVVVPGISPWEEVLKNPYIWHFVFHSIPSFRRHWSQAMKAPISIPSSTRFLVAPKQSRLMPGQITLQPTLLPPRSRPASTGTAPSPRMRA